MRTKLIRRKTGLYNLTNVHKDTVMIDQDGLHRPMSIYRATHFPNLEYRRQLPNLRPTETNHGNDQTYVLCKLLARRVNGINQEYLL